MTGLQRILTALTVLILSFAFANAALGACDTRNEILGNLKKSYDEDIIGRGVDLTGKRMVEITASPEGTWTVVVTQTNGWACTAQSGVGWQHIPVEAGERM